MNNQALEQIYNQRIQDIEKSIDIKSGGNEDLKQEGLIGAYKALSTDPQANKTFMLNKAKWSMLYFLRKGRSVDNGYYKRKNLKVIRYDKLYNRFAILYNAASPLKKEFPIQST
ncbi:MAG: hypothetical protein ABH950_02625 [Candidatus Altiarchaeota archaeon]